MLQLISGGGLYLGLGFGRRVSGSASAVAGVNCAPAPTTTTAAIASHPHLVQLMTADLTAPGCAGLTSLPAGFH